MDDEQPADENMRGEAELSLADQKIRAEIDKLKLESDLLKQQNTPRSRQMEFFKAISSLSGVIAILATLGGLGLSYSQWLTDQRASRETRHQELWNETDKRFDNALGSLSSENVNVRRSAVNKLKSFMNIRLDSSVTPDSLEADRQRQADLQKQVLGALADQLDVETDSGMQTIIVEFIKGLDATIPEPARKACLEALLTANRHIASKVNTNSINLKDRDYRKLMSEPKTEELRPLVERNYSAQMKLAFDDPKLEKINSAIISLLRLGTKVTDFSATILNDADLSEIQFADGSDFHHSFLQKTNFRKATLRQASFDSADLSYTNFVGANLQNADFSYHGKKYNNTDVKSKTNYIERSIFDGIYKINTELDQDKLKIIEKRIKNNRATLITSKFPNFSCADLSNARFDNAIIGVINLKSDILNLSNSKFQGANLKGTDFHKVKFISISNIDPSDIQNEILYDIFSTYAQKKLSTYGIIRRKSIYYSIFSSSDSAEIDTDTPHEQLEEYKISLKYLSEALLYSNWKDAKWGSEKFKEYIYEYRKYDREKAKGFCKLVIERAERASSEQNN